MLHMSATCDPFNWLSDKQYIPLSVSFVQSMDCNTIGFSLQCTIFCAQDHFILLSPALKKVVLVGSITVSLKALPSKAMSNITQTCGVIVKVK